MERMDYEWAEWGKNSGHFLLALLYTTYTIYIYLYYIYIFSHWHIAVGALAFNTRLGEPECGGAAAVGSAAQRFNLRLL